MLHGESAEYSAWTSTIFNSKCRLIVHQMAAKVNKGRHLPCLTMTLCASLWLEAPIIIRDNWRELLESMYVRDNTLNASRTPLRRQVVG